MHAQPRADLRATLTADRLIVEPGASGSDLTTLTLAVANDGPDATGATASQPLPTRLRFVSAAPSQGAYDSATGVWEIGTLATGTQVTLQVQTQALAQVSGTAPACIIATATASPAAATVDPAASNNAASLALAAPTCANLDLVSLRISGKDEVDGSPGPTINPPNIRHTVQIRNSGPSPATDVVVAVVGYLLQPQPTFGATAKKPPDQASRIEVGTIAVGETREAVIADFDLSPAQDVLVAYTVTFAAREPDPTPVPTRADSYLIQGENGPSNGSQCFIATAAYGSALAPEVSTLRRFRDRSLLTNAPGRAFVDWYYRVSPPIADYIRDREWARAATRGALRPALAAVDHPGGAGAAIAALLLLASGAANALRARSTRRARVAATSRARSSASLPPSRP